MILSKCFCFLVEEELRIVRGCGWVPNNSEYTTGKTCFNRAGTHHVSHQPWNHFNLASWIRISINHYFISGSNISLCMSWRWLQYCHKQFPIVSVFGHPCPNSSRILHDPVKSTMATTKKRRKTKRTSSNHKKYFYPTFWCFDQIPLFKKGVKTTSFCYGACQLSSATPTFCRSPTIPSQYLALLPRLQEKQVVFSAGLKKDNFSQHSEKTFNQNTQKCQFETFDVQCFQFFCRDIEYWTWKIQKSHQELFEKTILLLHLEMKRNLFFWVFFVYENITNECLLTVWM